MKVVGSGSTFKIYTDDLKTYDRLPAAVYRVELSEFTGFFLELQPISKITEKIYGNHNEKVTKILNSFKKVERNLGVIFSGDKGIGKSIAAKLLSERAIENNLPVILVNHYFPGLANFLNSITQDAVIIFDEFDKMFASKNKNQDDDPQTELLSLLDGFNFGKKLFVVTCNELHNLNDFLVNRPGRFHYHIIFSYPTSDEIREYLHDKLDPKYYGEIENVVNFANNVELNYDCLRAIAFELNNGLQFTDAISDLNIINYNKNNDIYTAILTFENGTKLVIKRYTLNPYNQYEDFFEFENDSMKVEGYFLPIQDLQYSLEKGGEVVLGDRLTDVRIFKYQKNSKGQVNTIEIDKNKMKIKEIVFKKLMERRDFHYAF